MTETIIKAQERLEEIRHEIFDGTPIDESDWRRYESAKAELARLVAIRDAAAKQ